MNSKAPAIRAALRERYPCQEVPFGGLSDLAREFGVSREYVRQQAAAYSMTTVARPPTVYLCACGAQVKTPGVQVCPECRWVDLPCLECGKTVRRSLNRLIVSQGKAFCTISCFGLWQSRHTGFVTANTPGDRCPEGHLLRVSRNGVRWCNGCRSGQGRVTAA